MSEFPLVSRGFLDYTGDSAWAASRDDLARRIKQKLTQKNA
jgi:hypothetical protein